MKTTLNDELPARFDSLNEKLLDGMNFQQSEGRHELCLECYSRVLSNLNISGAHYVSGYDLFVRSDRILDPDGLPWNLDERKDIIEKFYIHLKLEIFHFCFSEVESVIRRMLREVAPSRCNDARSNFEGVYLCVFKTIGISNRVHWESFWKLLSLTRNTIHNNGVFLPKNPGSVTIQFKGADYEFIDGDFIEHMSLPFVLDLVDDWILFFNDLCESFQDYWSQNVAVS